MTHWSKKQFAGVHEWSTVKETFEDHYMRAFREVWSADDAGS